LQSVFQQRACRKKSFKNAFKFKKFENSGAGKIATRKLAAEILLQAALF
jgi:hypothetical protein